MSKQTIRCWACEADFPAEQFDSEGKHMPWTAEIASRHALVNLRGSGITAQEATDNLARFVARVREVAR